MNTAQAFEECMTIALQAIPAGVTVNWPGAVDDLMPQNSQWMRITMQHLTGEQASLSCEHGQRRWRRIGQLAFQCFAPLVAGGRDTALATACVMRDAYQGEAVGPLWFRSATITEIGPDGAWYQVNAFVTFEYDEVA